MLRYGQTPKKQVARPLFSKNFSKHLTLYNIRTILPKILLLSIFAKQKLFYQKIIFFRADFNCITR